jgi:hypothetical protein
MDNIIPGINNTQEWMNSKLNLHNSLNSKKEEVKEDAIDNNLKTIIENNNKIIENNNKLLIEIKDLLKQLVDINYSALLIVANGDEKTKKFFEEQVNEKN